jgi:hypothetical protein
MPVSADAPWMLCDRDPDVMRQFYSQCSHPRVSRDGESCSELLQVEFFIPIACIVRRICHALWPVPGSVLVPTRHLLERR